MQPFKFSAVIGQILSTQLNIHASLIAGCKAFDPHSQREIYRLYSKAMLNTAFRIVGARQDAEDVIQEAFISAFHHIERYREEATFGAWLKRIVINKALTHIRKNGRMMPLEEDFDVAMEETALPTEGISIDQVREAILELPDGFRTVLSLYLLEGYDHVEISEILGISVSTSKTQYMRAKEKLKMILQQQKEPGWYMLSGNN